MTWRVFRQYKNSLPQKAFNLRLQSTSGESRLWKILRQLRFSHNLKFRRQQPIGKYIADFYCPALKCVVELDGPSHEHKFAQDAARDAYMQAQGLQVLRFTERDVWHDPEAIVQSILHAARTPPLAPPARGGEFDLSPAAKARE